MTKRTSKTAGEYAKSEARGMIAIAIIALVILLIPELIDLLHSG